MAVYLKIETLKRQKAAREDRDITDAEIANFIGLSRQAFQHWKNDTINSYDKRILSKLCRYFGCAINDLLEYVPDESGREPA
jgi:putative transcriptional regulator